MNYLIIILFLLINNSNVSNLESKLQEPIIFTDFKPEYRNWKTGYIIDKIEYTKSEVIFSFRYISKISGLVYFHGRGTRSAWILQDIKNPEITYEHTIITDIYSNDILLKKSLQFSQTVFNTKEGDVFTCKVHFRRLPSTIKKIHFIEGKGMQNDPDHFNCFDVKLKSLSDDLGNDDDMKHKIEDFEKKSDAIFAKEFLRLMNKMRNEGCICGNIKFKPAPSVIWNVKIAKASKIFVEHLWEQNSMTTDDDGKTTVKRLMEVGYKSEKAYENISHGFENIKQAFKGWKSTPPQCIRMMDKNIKEIGAARKGKYWSLVMPIEK